MNTFQCFKRTLSVVFVLFVTIVFHIIMGYEVQAAQCYSKPKRVAVVGAGASGLTAARTLMEAGHQVVVFEKENRVGGKVFTIMTAPDTYMELGAVFIIPDDYKITLAYATEFGIPSVPLPSPFSILDEFGNTLTAQEFMLSRYTLSEIAVATQNYTAMLAKFADYIASPDFTNLPPDLELPFNEFASLYGIEPIAEVMRAVLVGIGYGYYETVPAAYYVKALPVFLKIGPTGPYMPTPYVFPTGFQSIFDALAATMDVRLNSEVTQIKRSDEDVVITVNGISKFHFDKVVISAPLNVVHNFLDVTQKERRLFGQLNTNRYFLTVFGALGVDQSLFFYDNARPDRINHVVAWGGQLDASGLFSGSAYQITDRDITPAGVIDVLIGDLASRGGVFLGAALQQEWPHFFPHVTSELIEAGFYDRMEALQGKRHTYYVGGSLTLEGVETVAQHARDLILRKFRKCHE